MNDPWKCPQCSRVNAPWVPHCDCHITGTASTFSPAASSHGVITLPVSTFEEDLERLKQAEILAINSNGSVSFIGKPNHESLETDAQKYEKMQANEE